MSDKTMQTFISSLLIWIEDNLENEIDISTISERAGYSSWHLQRIFSKCTGVQLGRYIRERRLCKSAIALKLTRMTILSIALRYQFDSHQTFSRRFKAFFGTTPNRWRNENFWDFSKLRPKFKLSQKILPMPALKKMKILCGDIFRYESSRPIDVLFSDEVDINTERVDFLNVFLRKNKNHSEVICLFNNYVRGKTGDVFSMFYDYSSNVAINEYNVQALEGTMYLSFKWQSSLEQSGELIKYIYLFLMPNIGCLRKNEGDILIFQKDAFKKTINSCASNIEFLIPILKVNTDSILFQTMFPHAVGALTRK